MNMIFVNKKIGEIVIGHLNTNSIRQKFDSLIEINTGWNIDIVMTSETKLDEFSKRSIFKKRL